MTGIRDVFAHHYGSLDYDMAWNTSKEDIEDLERKENMKIATIHCKHAIDLPECWADWGGSDPRVSSEEEPQDYDFEADFFAPSEEEIAEFQAMREAYGYRMP